MTREVPAPGSDDELLRVDGQGLAPWFGSLADVMDSQGQGHTFELRPGQQQMAQAVADALRDHRDLLVEAGTGTGKTFAYLLPILLSGQKALIATATRHLQSQILEHDLPIALAAAGVERTIAVLKGRTNYLCHLRVNQQLQRNSLGLGLPWNLMAVERVLRTSPVGDRNEVSGVSEDDVLWPDVTSTTDNCLGSACPYISECFVAAARRRALAADLVVVNHHLLLADYSLRERFDAASLLPAVAAIVIDEAHALYDTATAYFGSTWSERKFQNQIKDLRRMAETIASANRQDRFRDSVDAAEQANSTLQTALSSFLHQQLIDEKGQLLITPSGLALDEALELLQEQTMDPALAAETPWQKLGETLYELRQELHRTLLQVGPGQVRWAEERGRDMAVLVRPIDVAPVLQRTLLAEPAVRIFTSATLAVGQRFDAVIEQLGLPADTTAKVIPGAFDYPRQSMLYVPVIPEPFSHGRDEAVAEALERLLLAAAGGTFALFSSHRALRDAASRLAGRIGMTCLVQGQGSKEALLERFVQEQPAVLLATMGFWQGVDLPAECLRVVAIDKIPFPPPDDPLLVARAALVSKAGRSAFDTLSMPAASLALRQGFGRLIRSRRHFGVVAVLDPRLADKRYGRQLVQHLPAAKRTREFSEVLAFLADHLAEGSVQK